MSKPVIVVFGATGQQGSGAVAAITKQGKFAVRAVTRNLESVASVKLAANGAEIVKADFDDRESISKALDGAYGVFLMTDLGGAAKGDPNKEIEQGETVIKSAKEAGVKHLVFSSLEDVRRLLPKGALPEVAPGRIVPVFESKAEVEEYLKASGIPYTVLLTSGFYENFLKYYQYQKQADGTYVFAINAGFGGIPMHAAADIGASASVALSDPEKYIGKTIPVVAEHLSFADAAKIISDVTGKTVEYHSPSREEAAAYGFPGAAAMANMWDYCSRFPFFAERRRLEDAIVKGQSFKEWAQDHKAEMAAKLQ